jgi:hypothetical protein
MEILLQCLMELYLMLPQVAIALRNFLVFGKSKYFYTLLDSVAMLAL